MLLEMLTGQPVFAGETVSHVLAAVLKSEPDWTTLPADTPTSIRKLLRRCLDKNRKRRLADIADARFEIDEALTAPSAAEVAAASPATVPRALWKRVAPVAAGIVVTARDHECRLVEPPTVAVVAGLSLRDRARRGAAVREWQPSAPGRFS